MKCPCKECRDLGFNYFGCHFKCEKYLEFDRKNVERRESHLKENVINDYFAALGKVLESNPSPTFKFLRPNFNGKRLP